MFPARSMQRDRALSAGAATGARHSKLAGAPRCAGPLRSANGADTHPSQQSSAHRG